MGMKQKKMGERGVRKNVGQPHNHRGWATSMPFASINPTNPRLNAWNFWKKTLRIGGIEKLSFYESAILELKKKSSFPWKSVTNYICDRMDGTQF